jgi:hypothetical protein
VIWPEKRCQKFRFYSPELPVNSHYHSGKFGGIPDKSPNQDRLAGRNFQNHN